MSDGHIFVSYSEIDSSVARGLAAELRKLGHTTWLYEEDGSQPGVSYLELVHGAILSCRAFVLIASTASLASHHVTREAEVAYESKKRIIPVLFASHTKS